MKHLFAPALMLCSAIPFAAHAGPAASSQIQGVRGENVCMNALGGVKEGAPIGLWGCKEDSGPNAQFTTDKANHILVGGLCLASPKGRYVIATGCGNGGVLTFTADGKLLKAPGNMCLDEEEGKTGWGTKIVIWQCHGDTNQQWTHSLHLSGEKPPAPAPVAVVAPPPPPPPAPAPAAPAVAACPDDNFQAIVDAIENESFSSDKIGALKTAADSCHFSVEQVGKLVDLYSFSGDKIAALKIVKGSIVDPSNNFKLLEHFTFSKDKEDVRKLLGK